MAHRLLCSQAAHARPNLYLSVVRFEYYFLNRLLKVFDRFKMYVSYALRVKGNEIIGMLSDTVLSLSDIIRYSQQGAYPVDVCCLLGRICIACSQQSTRALR